MAHVEKFHNTRTGRTLAANPGSHAHTRMVQNPVQFERVEQPAPKRTRKTPKPADPDNEGAPLAAVDLGNA